MKSLIEGKFRLSAGVSISLASEGKFSDFEKNYLTVREKEKRVLSIDEIKLLPNVAKVNPDYVLWEIRKKNISRFLKYLNKKNRRLQGFKILNPCKRLNILDIGCGNGFFTNLMALQGNKVSGVDVNLFELKQAAEAFDSPDISWYYADVMKEQVSEEKFDLITFCCSFQYFDDPVALLKRCKTLLSKNGEIHIIDSPFYTEKTKIKARENSRTYYEKMNMKSMADYYHHNSYEVLNEFNFSFKYKPGKLFNKIFRVKESPFPWIVIS